MTGSASAPIGPKESDVSGVAASMRHKVLSLKPVRRVIGTPQFVAVGKRVAPRTDLILQRLTAGKVSLVGLAGASFLVLHTVGRKSGLPRTTPLLCSPAEGGYLVIGSNWGQVGQPGWAFNLVAEPDASIEVKGRRIAVTAHVLDGDERAVAWAQMTELWPPFDDYVVRAGGRPLLVFLLKTKD